MDMCCARLTGVRRPWQSVSKLNFRAIVDGLGDVLFKFPFTVPPYYALILRSLTVLEGLAITVRRLFPPARLPQSAWHVFKPAVCELRRAIAMEVTCS